MPMVITVMFSQFKFLQKTKLYPEAVHDRLKTLNSSYFVLKSELIKQS